MIIYNIYIITLTLVSQTCDTYSFLHLDQSTSINISIFFQGSHYCTTFSYNFHFSNNFNVTSRYVGSPQDLQASRCPWSPPGASRTAGTWRCRWPWGPTRCGWARASWPQWKAVHPRDTRPGSCAGSGRRTWEKCEKNVMYRCWPGILKVVFLITN